MGSLQRATGGLAVSLLSLLTLAADLSAAGVDYLRDIKPILRSRCYSCHGAVRQKARLRLDAASLLLKGGKHGPVVVSGKANESLIMEAVLGQDRPRMPPDKEGRALSAAEIALLRDWINQGAHAPNEPIPADPRSHWAYRPPVRPPMPPASGLNPVDAFVDAERSRQGLHANPPADRAVLLRRVYLDLIGMPLTREELHAFLEDPSPNAYEKVVERLLASPQYGERWGRHWMDVWRYSDPFGLGEEYRYSQRHIWRWRDWIIDALNADKGYDRMIVEMLAGDELAPTDRATLRATGYLARNWYKFNRNVWLQDTVEYTAAGFLGITLRCARCHDHKYDPIAQQDYYRFRAFFESHDIRIDPVPGQPNLVKDGVARAFDARPEALTYLFRRGDERNPDKTRALTPGVPAVLGGDLVVRAVHFTPRQLAQALKPAIDEARRLAQAEVDAADAGVAQAKQQLQAAQRSLQDVGAASRAAPKDRSASARRTYPDVGAASRAAPVWSASARRTYDQPAFLHDTFAMAMPGRWRVLSGTWVWEKGRLVCKKPSSFATVTTTKEHPAQLMGRLRYRTTGGGIGSVGLSYDVAGKDFQAIYINAGNSSAVRAFHRSNGQDTYPSAGVVPHPVKFGDVVTLDFAVRDNLLNTWVNGRLRNVYHLPKPRRAGVFTLWAHEATVEFLELRLAALPDSVALAEKPGVDRPSPLAGPVVLTKADAESLVKQAEAALAIARQRQDRTRAALEAVAARAAAERARSTEPVDERRRQTLARAASKAERHLALLKAREDLLEAADDKKRILARKALAAAETALKKEDEAYTPLVRVSPTTSTGRRLALARWIASRDNPLTARVAVNHIWMRHFGKPLVPTVANFGLSGKPPTHPALLDFLAVEFMESGWSMKHLHRLIVCSGTYRLSARADASSLAADPENRFLWRMNPRRMEGEVVRDSLLAVAGSLDSTVGGPILNEKQGQTTLRRSVYFRFNTEYKMGFLDVFDPASPTECYERRESIVPQQALALNNSALALNQARRLAGRLTATTRTPSAFVIAAFEQVLGRAPTTAERERCERFLHEQAILVKEPGKLTPFPAGADAVTPPAATADQRARENLILVLFNHNDFVTIR